MKNVHYSGDVNVEYGGMCYVRHDDWADALRVTPCSDAGLPDNLFWLEKITVYIDSDQLDQSLACCGCADEYANATNAIKRHIAVDALVSYGAYDVDMCEVVRIGKPDKFWSGRDIPPEPDVILRSGSSLKRY